MQAFSFLNKKGAAAAAAPAAQTITDSEGNTLDVGKDLKEISEIRTDAMKREDAAAKEAAAEAVGEVPAADIDLD